MTTLQDTTYYLVDSPLNDWQDEELWADYETVTTVDPMVQVQRRMVIILIAVIFFVMAFTLAVVRSTGNGAVASTTAQTDAVVEEAAPVAAAPAPGAGGIAPLFTAEVQHWAPQIVAWSAAAGVDPNMAATVMQIESCGDPNAVSIAGAQGLFQVMPFHFDPGENMQDPDTNARRGLSYLALGMQQHNGDTGLSFAGYNGGHGTAAKGWGAWPAETQRYYNWSTGIYADAVAGNATSDTLNQWLAAGGSGLCRQAAQRIGLQ
jgi:soluble lytic murein transglycosylase-like protein